MGRRTFFATAFCAVLATGAISVAGAGAAGGPSATASGKLPLLIGNCAKPTFRPANLIFTCGDASLGATNVVWSSWNQTSADGAGTGQLNDCNPNCAQGKPKTGPISVHVSKPVTCKKSGRRIFTKLSYTWTSGAPVGNVPDSGSVGVGCKLASL
jgi:hypothetical protein